MLNFQLFIPTRIIFGPGKLAELATTPNLPKGDKAMIVIGESGAMITNGYLDKVQAALAKQNVSTLVFDKISPNPQSDQIDEAAKIARDKKIDFIVALGGGSTIDAAKAIALLLTNVGKCWDYIQSGSGGGINAENPAAPLIAIPTTSGTGSEADQWAVINKSGGAEKISLGNDSTFPAMSIVDPELMISVPPRMTAYTGIDAFFHAVETFVSTKHQPVSDMLALESVHLISNYLPMAIAEGDNIEGRTVMAWASTAAGMCETLSRCISQHSLEHALSAKYPTLPHGLGLAKLSVPYFKRLIPGSPDRFEDLAMAMGYDTQSIDENMRATIFLEGLRNLLERTGFNDESLKTYGAKEEDVPELVAIAYETMGKLFDFTPTDMTQEDLECIMSEAIAS
ncbi:iron-containing alcohol dehydrogenase [Maridesulfovibrio hydrothermalis]|uniref:Iron-containing alcohol dehydrogenase n=1 Tax=Maridesulfovibrio hydrothermalis AM13 = DSM 14728 TaxID=1121451 RepID=L0RDT0_9BACT|nr:iron-containing alcohol dehydrogenase [Maridesulfovibrio hydrothermalis]CCO24899.1 Iron-containing alcohol dehydrogenase [Maridesulfovibrio hydrothermalis AM13 = DSM 14728]